MTKVMFLVSLPPATLNNTPTALHIRVLSRTTWGTCNPNILCTGIKNLTWSQKYTVCQNDTEQKYNSTEFQIGPFWERVNINLLCTLCLTSIFPGCTCNSRISFRAKLFKLNFFIRKTSSRFSNQASKIIFTTSQFTHCPAVDETPDKLTKSTEDVGYF